MTQGSDIVTMTLLLTLNDTNHPKSTLFYVLVFISLQRVKLQSLNLMCR